MNEKLDREVTELLLKNALEEYDNEKCDAIIEKYKDTEPEYSEEHKRRMEKLFRKEKHAFSWKKGLLRAAMVILAIFICGSLALQVEAVRIHIENWCYEVTNKAIHIGDSIEDLPGYSETEMPIYVLSDEFVEKYGFSVTQEINKLNIVSEHKNINNEYIMFIQYIDRNNMHIDNSSGEMIKQIINGKEVIMVSRNGDLSIYLESETALLCIHTNLGEEKINELIENIVIKS